MYTILGCLILVILIRYKTRNRSPQDAASINAFLKRELEANTTRKKDISDLPYLIADCSRLPDISCPDPEGEIRAVLKQLFSLNGAKLLNLSGNSNTDLKLAYGAANFPILSECDARYTAFTRNLQRLGSLLYEAGDADAALQTLSYALELRTDIAATYRLLGRLFAEQNNAEGLARLKEQADSLPELTKDSVFRHLNGL